MRTLDLTTPLDLKNGKYLCVERSGNQLTLRSLFDGSYITLHSAELTNRLLSPPPMVNLPARSLDALSRPDKASVSTLAAHLREVETGERDGYDTPRPQYDPALTTRMQRMQAKVAELEGTAHAMGYSTLKRKLKQHSESGAAALIDGRKQKTAGTFDNIDARVAELMRAIVDGETNRSTGTVTRLIRTLRRQVNEYCPDAALTLPSDATLRRRFDELAKGRYTTGNATTRRSRNNVPKDKHKHNWALVPGAEIQIDSTMMDIEVIDEKGNIVRPYLTIAIDVATRSIVAATMRIGGTTGTDHAFLVAQMMTGPQFRPDRAEYRAELDAMLRATHPGLRLLPASTRKKLEEARPFVYPRAIVTDNGRDYLSDTFRSSCRLFGVDIRLSAPHTPTDKPIVERQFGTIISSFTEHLPGHVGNNPVNRGRRPKSAALLDVHTLFELFDDWVINIWQNSPHPALQDRLDSSIRLTPNQAFAAATEMFGAMPMSLDRDTFLELLPSDWRTIGQAGVEYDKRHYDAEELSPLRFTKSDAAHKNGKWELKYHPYDPLVIWVRGRDGRLIECRDRKEHIVQHPQFADLQKARRDEFRGEVAARNAAATGTPMPAPSVLDFDDDTEPTRTVPATTTKKLARFDPSKEY